MNVERLQKLSQFLRTVPRERFNYRIWFADLHHDWFYRPTACGTTACALGWACLMPEFNALGLRAKAHEPTYGTFSGLSAGGVFFDLSYRQAMHLFSSPSAHKFWEVTPSEVADRIDKLVAEHESKAAVAKAAILDNDLLIDEAKKVEA